MAFGGFGGGVGWAPCGLSLVTLLLSSLSAHPWPCALEASAVGPEVGSQRFGGSPRGTFTEHALPGNDRPNFEIAPKMVTPLRQKFGAARAGKTGCERNPVLGKTRQ